MENISELAGEATKTVIESGDPSLTIMFIFFFAILTIFFTMFFANRKDNKKEREDNRTAIKEMNAEHIKSNEALVHSFHDSTKEHIQAFYELARETKESLGALNTKTDIILDNTRGKK